MRPDAELILVDGTIKKLTERAMLLENDKGEQWIPLSQVSFPDSTAKKLGDKGSIAMSEWIYGQKYTDSV